MNRTIHEPVFEESIEQAQVKADIVSKYFWAWARAILPRARRAGKKIAYIDVFAGPGRDKDGTKTTPLRVLERAIVDPVMRKMLVSIFNDLDQDSTRSLANAIHELPGIQKLRFAPKVYDEDAGTEIVKHMEVVNQIPTLFLVDPWGYKGLSLQLINSVLRNWPCDCIFFFNYSRINVGLNNKACVDHLNALFGEDRANQLRDRLSGMNPEEREFEIVEATAAALQEMGGQFVLPFRFMSADGHRTSHHLIFVSKHALAYKIMKGVMAKESEKDAQGVPSFEYSPATARQPLLFQLSRSLDDLEEMLLTRFAGQKLTVDQIYRQHHVGTPYIKPNYKRVLVRLESAGKIKMKPPAARRPQRKGRATCANHILVTFPRR